MAADGLLSAEFVLLLLSLGEGELTCFFSIFLGFELSMVLGLLVGVLEAGLRLDHSSTGGVLSFSLA